MDRMISIIICSISEIFLAELKLNIAETIGVPYEIISVDNRNSDKGISEVYNGAAERANFPYLCFVHEDVKMETPDWGKNLIAHLSDPRVGLIGIAGGDTKSIVPSSWSSSVFESEISLIQHFKDKNRLPERISKTGYPESDKTLKPVCCIDGVWMATRRDVFENYRFDPQTCPRFHGYDIDYSLNVFSAYSIGVVSDILLHHFSEGSYNSDWLKAIIAVSEKWKKNLPCTVRRVPRQELVRQHWTSMNIFIDYMLHLNLGKAFMMYQCFRYSFNRYFQPMHFMHSLRKIIFSVYE